MRALDVELRVLRLRRALLHQLATLSARERQQMIDAFVARAFAGVPPDAPGSHLAASMRTLPAELPDDPTAEQVSAWLELAGLLEDPAFADRVRHMAVVGAMATPEDADAMQVDMGRLQILGRTALAEQVQPGSARAEALVRDLLDDGRPPAPDRRAALAERLATFIDARVERYWLLLGVLNGWPAWEPSVPAVNWWIQALRD